MSDREIEAKFELQDPTQMEHWRTLPALADAFALESATTVTQTDTYLDSAEYSLLRAGYALRLRAGAHGYLVTLKTLSLGSELLVHNRLELEGPISDGADPLQMKQWPKEIRNTVKPLVEADTPWQVLCTLQQTRHKRAVLAQPIEGETQQPIAELSIDEVRVYGPDFTPLSSAASAPAQAAKPITEFQEIELELKPDQDEAVLAHVAQWLQEQPGLTPNHTSKLERALESISVSIFDGEKYSAFIQPTMHMAEACRLLWRQQFTHMLLAEAGVCHSDDDEYIHKMRVAIRRARVAGALFASYFQRKAIRRFDKIMKRTGRLLGKVRDLDVAYKNLKEFQAEQPEAELADLETHWRAVRKQARHALLAWLDSKKYTDFIAEFAHFCQTSGKGAKEFAFEPGEPPTPYQVRHVMPSLLINRFERVRCFEILFETDAAIPASILHLLRIECKYMRYSLEFASHLLGQEGEQLIDVLKQLQDHLGELNDANVSRALLHSLPRSVDTEAVKGYANAQSQRLDQLRSTVVEALRDFLGVTSRRKLAEAIVQI